MQNRILVSTAVSLVLVVTAGCAGHRSDTSSRVTHRDKTAKGAAIGAAAGATTAVIAGKRDADQILVGAAIGGAVGAGVGAYMDAQEERLARIPGTHVERVDNNTLLVRFDSDILFRPDSARLGPAARGDGRGGRECPRRVPQDGRRRARAHGLHRAREPQHEPVPAPRRNGGRRTRRARSRAAARDGHWLRGDHARRDEQLRARPPAQPSRGDPAQGQGDLGRLLPVGVARERVQHGLDDDAGIDGLREVGPEA